MIRRRKFGGRIGRRHRIRKGGFIGPLLGALAPLGIKLISGLFGRRSQQPTQQQQPQGQGFRRRRRR